MTRVDSDDVTFGLIMLAVAAFVIFTITFSPRFPREQTGGEQPSAAALLQQEPTVGTKGP